MSIRLLLVGALFTSLVAAALPADKPPDPLQGTWVATSAVSNGQASKQVVGHHLAFAGDKFTVTNTDGKLVYEGTFKTDAAKKPAAIDFIHSGDTLKGATWKGIYAIDGDTLKICDNAPDLKKDRPADFEAKADSGYVSIVFKRVKK